MKYWVYLNGEVPGSFAPEELTALPGFSGTTLVCPAEGGTLERSWRRSGEFPDIIKVLHERADQDSPDLPESQASVNELIDTTSAKIFTHVAGLLNEVKNRREELELVQSLQRQHVEAQAELERARERVAELESKLKSLPELEEARRQGEARLSELEGALQAKEETIAELKSQWDNAQGEMEAARRKLNESLEGESARSRLIDKLSYELAEKELSLKKALDVIHRLEEEFSRLGATGPIEAASAPTPVSETQPAAPETLPEAQAPEEKPSTPPQDPAPREKSIKQFIRKIFPKHDL